MPLPPASDLPYLAMRIIRRKCFPTAIPRWISNRLPGFRSNAGTLSCARVVQLYEQYLALQLGPDWPQGRRVLEVGIGRTNSSAYELAARGAKFAAAFEPFVPLDSRLDDALLAECTQRHGCAADRITSRVQRWTSLAAQADDSIDLVLSNSVLEHVGDMDALTRDLQRVLAPGGVMLHLVDYRDHFFQFPYHHLLWSDAMWNRWLNPGDLPRWRIRDHVQCFERHGFQVETLRATGITDEFSKVKSRIHPRFQTHDEQSLSTAFGVLLVRQGKEVRDQKSEVSAGL